MRLRSERIALIAAAVLGVGAAAYAQPRSVSLEGAWRFETSPHPVSGCVLRGDALVAPARGGRHTVQIDVTQHCGSEVPYKARERCEATTAGGRVTMTCVVVSSETGGYQPDSFDLAPGAAGVMTGRLVDTGVWNVPVTWRRPSAALVS
jgi:hypothetical protein